LPEFHPLKQVVAALLSFYFLTGAYETIAATAGGSYEPYAGPIHSVLNRLDADNADFGRVCELMRKGRSFRYQMRDPYRVSRPEVTEARRSGCCKDKSLWLASRINDDSIRYVIGRARSNSRGLHAWLVWESGGQFWVLDCTNYRTPLRKDRLAPGEYVGIFQWRKGR
jgi:hypothetical protein